MKIMLVSTLYPNAVQQRHGIFVETRLLQTLKTQDFQATVIAPVPWFPKWLGFLSDRYLRYAKVPSREERSGITVYHPRYLVIPKVGMLLTPFFLAFSISRAIRKLMRREGRFDIIDAHYFYPDGVAAALVASLVKTPLLITARGSDINYISRFKLPLQMMGWASRVAQTNIAVSESLSREMKARGFESKRICVVPNGVDLHTFSPAMSEKELKQRSTSEPLILSIGNLVELKGHDLVIRAMSEVPSGSLLIVGDGPLRKKLQSLIDELSLNNRVKIEQAVPREQLVKLYRRAALTVLASSREGMPNVVLESLACGTPVVATPVGGVPEVLTEPEMGRLVEERSSTHIANAIRSVLASMPDPSVVRGHAEHLSWDNSIDKLMAIYRSVSEGACQRRAGVRL